MDATRSLLVRETIVGEPEPRDDERSEAARSGGSPTIVRETSSAPPDPEVTTQHARRRFTTHYKLEILRKADGCTRPGQLGALLRKEGLYSSLLVTWRRQREEGLTGGRLQDGSDVPNFASLVNRSVYYLNRKTTASLLPATAVKLFPHLRDSFDRTGSVIGTGATLITAISVSQRHNRFRRDMV